MDLEMINKSFSAYLKAWPSEKRTVKIHVLKASLHFCRLDGFFDGDFISK